MTLSPGKINHSQKILITTVGLSSVGQGGGISSYVHDLATNLTSYGHDVTVFLIKEQSNNPPINISYKYEIFVLPIHRMDEFSLVNKLLMAINKFHPDVIINNDVAYIAGLWPVLSENIIRISVIHGFINKFSWSILGIMGKIATLNWKYIDFIVCQNTKMVLDVAEKYNLPSNKLVCIPQSVTIKNRLKKQKSAEFSIVFAGGMNINKGADEMIKISRLLMNTSLPFKLFWCLPAEKISSIFKEDDRFNFEGNLSREAFLNLLASSDCIIIPTHMDTGPLLLVEALAFGVVPICNNLTESAIPDLIENDVNGYKITGNDPHKYVWIIKKLMEDGVNEKSEAAIKYFQNNLTAEKQVDQYNALFHRNREKLRPSTFTDKNVLHYHSYKTSNLPIYSLKRLIPKILNAFEIPLTEKLYQNYFSKLL